MPVCSIFLNTFFLECKLQKQISSPNSSDDSEAFKILLEGNGYERYLHNAAENGEIEIFHKCQLLKFPTKVPNDLGRLPIHTAIANDQIEVVEILLKEDETLKNSTDFEGQTPLHLSAMNGNLDIFKLLMNKEDNLIALENENDKGLTPLGTVIHILSSLE